VGVAAPGFFGITPGAWIDVYRPLATMFGALAQENPGFKAQYWNLEVLARPAVGQSGSAAASALTPAFRGLVAETMGADVDQGVELVTRPAARGLHSGRNGDIDRALWILMLLVGVLLLIVCANVANLLLSRAVKRRAESAIRLALGAGRGRLVRQHLVESGMLAVFGGAAGLGLGVVLARWIHTVFQTGQGPAAAFAVGLDWRVSGYAVAIATLTAVIFGLAPAWTAARSNVSNDLKNQARSVVSGGIRLPKLLVSVQFALSFAALGAAGLLGRSLGNLYSTDLGFDAAQLSFATVWPASYGPATVLQYRERLKREVEAIPGVAAVAQLMWRPLEAEAIGGGQAIEAPAGPPVEQAPGISNPAARAYVSLGGPGFVGVLGLELLAGRTLEPGEGCDFLARIGEAAMDASSPPCPVVVDQRFADVFFQSRNPVGQVFRVLGRFHHAVGLVSNARLYGLRHEARPMFYAQVNAGGLGAAPHLAIRAQIDSEALGAAVRQAVARVDPTVPLAEFHTQSGLVDRLLRTERLLAQISGAFSLAALALAAVGLAGLLSYAVSRRTNEIGIRMALGATGGQVRRMVLVESVAMVGAGVLVGVPAAWAVGRYLRSQLVGLEPNDPSTTALSLLALVVIAGLASLLPARRATRVNPLTALRED
jgi:predicted permease